MNSIDDVIRFYEGLNADEREIFRIGINYERGVNPQSTKLDNWLYGVSVVQADRAGEEYPEPIKENE